jgi:hypothetical protein
MWDVAVKPRSIPVCCVFSSCVLEGGQAVVCLSPLVSFLWIVIWDGAFWFWSVVKTIMTDSFLCYHSMTLCAQCRHTYIHTYIHVCSTLSPLCSLRILNTDALSQNGPHLLLNQRTYMYTYMHAYRCSMADELLLLPKMRTYTYTCLNT